MSENELLRAIEDFSSLLLPVSEKDLECTWKGHGKQGIRLAFFVTIQELRQLAVILNAKRKPITQAQHILGQYHKQYMDLQAAIFGLSKEDADLTHAEGEWSVRQTYGHLLSADINFSAAIRYALENHRAGKWTTNRMSDEDEIRLVGMGEEEFNSLTKGPLEDMLLYHQKLHPKIIEEFSNITDDELELPSVLWEEIPFHIRYRLHRFEGHIIQHTVQIDKTLIAIGQAPNETKRLIRYLFSALAEVDANLIGESKSHEGCSQAAQNIKSRITEIQEALAQP
jgi:hypothetical protein